MQRRILPRPAVVAVLGALTVTLAACGDDSIEPPAATAPDPTVPTPDTTEPTPGTTVPEPGGIAHPDSADDVVISIAYEGGFMPIDGIFTQLPTLLVAGDGSAYVQGPQPAIYPGPLLPNVIMSELGADGIQELLWLADEHGLLAERDYEAPMNVADAPDTVVTVNANGETFVHRAYALGIGGGPGNGAETGARADLQAFVDAATGVFDGASPLGDGVPYVPETYLVRAKPADLTLDYGVEPTLVEWPAEVEVDLALASECLSVPADGVHDLFGGANQLTFFEQDGVTYQLFVKPQLPGMSC